MIDPETRKTIALALLIIGLILLSVIFYAWNVFLNFGYLILSSNPPFEVNVVDEKVVNCTDSPCEIKLKRGSKILTISAPDKVTENFETNVSLWKKEEIEFELKNAPKLERVEQYPLPAESEKLALKDSDNGKMLYSLSDPSERALLYFQNLSDQTKIFSTKNSAILIDEENQNAYFADLVLLKRYPITTPEILNATNVFFSANGARVVFSSSEKLYALKSFSESVDLEITTLDHMISFDELDNLFYINFNEASGENGYISLNSVNLETFEKNFITSVSLPALPDYFVAGANGKSFWFVYEARAYLMKI